MARRATWRIPLRLSVILNCGSRAFPGTVTNLSEYGMFISAEVAGFTEDAQCDISLPLKEGELRIPGKLVRVSKINGRYNGIGVELIDPPQKYLDFVENLLYVL